MIVNRNVEPRRQGVKARRNTPQTRASFASTLSLLTPRLDLPRPAHAFASAPSFDARRTTTNSPSGAIVFNEGLSSASAPQRHVTLTPGQRPSRSYVHLAAGRREVAFRNEHADLDGLKTNSGRCHYPVINELRTVAPVKNELRTGASQWWPDLAWGRPTPRGPRSDPHASHHPPAHSNVKNELRTGGWLGIFRTWWRGASARGGRRGRSA